MDENFSFDKIMHNDYWFYQKGHAFVQVIKWREWWRMVVFEIDLKFAIIECQIKIHHDFLKYSIVDSKKVIKLEDNNTNNKYKHEYTNNQSGKN